jgi:TIR domain
MSHDIFICYSARDKTIATAMCAVLEAEGIRCWMAPRDIVPGADWGESIIDAINEARAMVLVFSSNANDAQQQIKREIERAVNKGIPVVPFRIENVMPTKALEYFLSTPHWLDAFTPPLDDHVRQLADSIKRLLGKQATPRPNLTTPPPGPMPSLNQLGMGRAGTAEQHHKSLDAESAFAWAKKPAHAAILGVALVVLVAVLWFVFRPTATPEDQQAWNVAAMEDAIPAYQLYTREQPQGYYLSKANDRISELKSTVDDAFAKAKAANTAAAYQEFLNTYSKQGIDLDEARDAYANADAQENAVRTAYRRALQTRSRDGYQDFLNQYGSSSYAADVKQRLSQCHTQTQTSGGVQSSQLTRTGTSTNINQTNACAQARNNAAMAAQNACTGEGGRVGGETVMGQNVRNAASTGGQVVGSLLGSALFRNRNINLAANYECSVEVGLSCQKSVSSSRQVDVCP